MKTIKAQQLGQSLLLYFFQRVARVIRHVSGILLFEVRSGKLPKRAFDDTVRPLQYLSISQTNGTCSKGSSLSRLQYTLAVEQIVVVARRSRPGDVRNCRYLSGVDDAEAYQLENQLDIGDYDVRALLIRPQKSEEARSTREPYGYSEGFGH
ncbi:Major royal jelly protein 2 [Vespula squamosa]|uniref:Major royal jelly protein 2 n=1 Tax=Vespula squamosa TaxID=30214 RepID=A0ABD2A2K0_VESSQ